MDDPVEKVEAQAGVPLEPPSPLSLAKFLESYPPDRQYLVSNALRYGSSTSQLTYLSTIGITLHCDVCDGARQFKPTSSNPVSKGWNYEFVKYLCKNCEKTLKVFALVVISDGKELSARVGKLGEIPSFGPPIPSRVMNLVGPDRELFLKGRRSELRGLGIGAFAYYRRVVEEQKGRIIEEIGRVAQRLGAPGEVLQLFATAAAETQFSKAIELIKTAIPESLLINGHNPLTLLHGPLSEGLHEPQR